MRKTVDSKRYFAILQGKIPNQFKLSKIIGNFSYIMSFFDIAKAKSKFELVVLVLHHQESFLFPIDLIQKLSKFVMILLRNLIDQIIGFLNVAVHDRGLVLRHCLL